MTDRRAPANANPTLADRKWLELRYRRDEIAVADIAAEAGTDPATVWRALARHEIPLRQVAPGRRTLAKVSDRTVRTAVRRAETHTAAARDLSVDLATLIERLARMGDAPWPGGAEGAEQMAVEYAAGDSLAAIAEAHGISTRTVRRRLAAIGVEMRPVGRREAAPQPEG